MEAVLKEFVEKILEEKLDAWLCRLEEQLQKQTVMLQQTLPSPKLEDKLPEMNKEEQTNQITELDARLGRLEVQLQEQTVMLQQSLPSPKLVEKLSKMKEQLEDRTDHITEQLETKLRHLEKQLNEETKQIKFELLAELMNIEQNAPSPQALRTVSLIAQETQTTEETPDISTVDAENQAEELRSTDEDVGVQAHPPPKEEEKRWDVCGEGRSIREAVCRGERAVVAGYDGIVEVYSSGKVVGRCMELEGGSIWEMFCSDEYIGVWLGNYCIACYKWFSDRIEWLYCLYVKGQTWRKAERMSDVPEINNFSYKLAQDTVCCLCGDQVSGWSLIHDRTVFNIKVQGARDLCMTPDLVLVNIGVRVEVFTLDGSKLYSIGRGGIGLSGYYPLNNTNYTALVSSVFESTYIWPTSTGQSVIKIAASYAALHPHLPLLCSSVIGEPWELVVRDVSTDSVKWRRPQSGSLILVFSIDSGFLLIKPLQTPVQILRWSSGEVVATLTVAGDLIRSVSPHYIISGEHILYRDLTNR